MLSTRGQQYAQSGLMSGYLRRKGEPFDKHANPRGEISFSNAENFLIHDDLVRYVNANFKFDAMQCTYNDGPNGSKRLREAMASHINDYFLPFTPVTLDQITFTAGVTALNEAAACSLTDDGEALLLGRPIYGSFKGDFTTKSRCDLVYTSFGAVDQFSPACVEFYEKAILDAKSNSIKIKALIICNPHNPLGRCYPVATLKKLFQLCEKYDLHLVSDEIYALSTFEVDKEERTPFTSVLSIDPTGLIDFNKIHVMYGMSKDFGAAGLRLGCLVTQSRPMTDAIQAISRFHCPSEASSSIAATILEDKKFVVELTSKARGLLAEHYMVATKLLTHNSISYAGRGNAGFFVWIDLSPFLKHTGDDEEGWKLEESLQKSILEAGVPISSGKAYRAERPGWFRVITTVDKDALIEAIKRIVDCAVKHRENSL